MQQFLLSFMVLKQNMLKSWMFDDLANDFSNQNQRLFFFTPQDIWVHNSFFQNIRELDDEGGAILMRTSSCKTLLFVEETYFLNCSSRLRGGAIYQSPGNFKMHSVCCISSDIQFSEGFFVFSISDNSYDHFQEIDYCTLDVKFENSYFAAHEMPIVLLDGCISIKSLNLSQQTYHYGMALLPVLPYKEYENNVIQFSSFVNNSADNRQFEEILYFEAGMKCYMCNILYNDGVSLFSVTAALTIKNSCILENKFTQFVWQSSEYSVYLYNCTCQEVSSNYPSKIRTYSVPSSSFLHALDCFQTGYCVAQYDYLDNLNPYIPDENEDANIQSLSYLRLNKKKNIKLP